MEAGGDEDAIGHKGGGGDEAVLGAAVFHHPDGKALGTGLHALGGNYKSLVVRNEDEGNE